MLQINNISKRYKTGDLIQTALDDVSLNLRDNEFVAILGPSGSGKTTLLNVIGGLDRYDIGDLIIGGISTKKYRDKDWDSYRNHTIGFVFQSYNLIPHQSILANVELALTIGGISRAERRKRAKKALEQVGLGDQLHKKPNQMSGGQMQRVAIARALVNDPDILLADEPTGALDSETSIQVMELLKNVAKDRLVVMVTHNPELADKYATRIVKLKDGKVTDDSDPFFPNSDKLPPPTHKNMGKSSMSFLTSLTLSFNNLRTKKGRTILTSFAGSIGIIGISLILALSSGVNSYISDVQKNTMASYPIVVNKEAVDLSGMMGVHFSVEEKADTAKTEIFPDNSSSSEDASSEMIKNDLPAFKAYLDNPDSEIHKYLGENGIIYSYNVSFDVFATDTDGNIRNTNTAIEEAAQEASGSIMHRMSEAMGNGSASGAENFSELMTGMDGEPVSKVTTDSYEVLYGNWPKSYDEVVLVLDENNAVSTAALYQLGFITKQEYDKIKENSENELPSWSYEDFCGKSFNLIPSCDYYIQNENGTFSCIKDNKAYERKLLDNSVELKICGVVRPVKNSANTTISTAIAYTSLLTDYIIDYSNESEVVKAQVSSPATNILNGLAFEAPDDETKAVQASAYLKELNISDKASMFTMLSYMTGASAGTTDETELAAAMDSWLSGEPETEILLMIYNEYVNGATYEDNLNAFGGVSYDSPYSISIYADSFENKDAISKCIADYNETADSDITYTDYVELLTSSLTSIVDIISYVLIAFVSVSLIVSCIMIGIITHISVLERTKEIGILRAIGASKHNISQVFNAETFIIGICSGILGVGISMLLTIPINAVIGGILGADLVKASLPVFYALILVAISVIITVIGGLLPAKKAAKKDPVIALRSE